MGIEQCSAERTALDCAQRVANSARRACDSQSSAFERRDDVERDEKLVLDNKNGIWVDHVESLLRLDRYHPIGDVVIDDRFRQSSGQP